MKILGRQRDGPMREATPLTDAQVDAILVRRQDRLSLDCAPAGAMLEPALRTD